jgi:hypothetical protein
VQKTHFLESHNLKKAGALDGLPLRYYKDNTLEGEMQISFNFILQIGPLFLRIEPCPAGGYALF